MPEAQDPHLAASFALDVFPKAEGTEKKPCLLGGPLGK